ncbi:MAG: hypothetical protein GEV07_28780 [Streptosporangiales bacterium]|nr:hypothetical protein [Streptosporangiales bacterium]
MTDYGSTATVFSQDDLDAFGIVSGGTGLIHTEPEYARTTSFGATLVQGIYLLAVVERQLCELVPNWADGGTISVKFVSPVKTGDEFRVHFASDPDEQNRVQIEAHAGDRVALAGTAQLPA